MELAFYCSHVNADLHGTGLDSCVWQAKFQQRATMEDRFNSGALVISGQGGPCPFSVGGEIVLTIRPSVPEGDQS